jgi:hypothetical protein
MIWALPVNAFSWGLLGSFVTHSSPAKMLSKAKCRKCPFYEAWRGGRVVECTALEMRHTRKGIAGSNPALSAKGQI